MKKSLFYFGKQRTFLPSLKGYLFGLRQYLSEMLFYIKRRVLVAKPNAAFEMEYEASVIHIYRADGCNAVVRQEDFRM